MKIEVLDKGFVELVDFMGSDLRVCEAARVSTGAEADKGEAKNRKLIRYLYKNNHLTPFEKVVFEFHVKCPIFVARQWFRHRTFSYNEASARYKEFVWECFYPDQWRKQDTSDKQNSYEELDFSDGQYDISLRVQDSYRKAGSVYEEALNTNVAREQARTVMPVGQYTEFFMTCNMRNLFHFLDLRMHPHAQKEIRDYADAIHEILLHIPEIKFSVQIFDEVREIQYLVLDALNKYSTTRELKDYLMKFQGAENGR